MSDARLEAAGGEFGLCQEARIGAEPGTATGGSSTAAAIRQVATRGPSRSCTVWLHGWGTSPELWGDCERLLPEDAHTRFSYAGCATIAAMRGRLRDLIAVQPGPVRLIGWSLGGMLALEALLEQVEADGRFVERTRETAEGDQHHAGRIGHDRDVSLNLDRMQAADTPGFADIRGATHKRAETDLQLSGGAASGGRIVQALLVGSTPRFVSTDRQRGWSARLVRQMRLQLASDAEGVLRRFAAAMLSADERSALVDAAAAGPLRNRLSTSSRTDFSPAGLDAGLGYLLESDLRSRLKRLEQQRELQTAASGNEERCGRARMDGLYGSDHKTAGADGRLRSQTSESAAAAPVWLTLPDVRWIHGTADPICPPGALSEVEQTRVRWLEGAGHAPFLTQPESFAEAVRSLAYGNR